MYQTKIGRIQLKVRDLDRAIDFYSTFLNLQLIERVGDQFAFLGTQDAHPDVILQSVGLRAPQAYPYSVGLYHVAFQVADRHALAEAYKKLLDAGICAARVDHSFSWAIYFNDPDGNGLAIYCDTTGMAQTRSLWRGCNIELSEEQLLARLQEND